MLGTSLACFSQDKNFDLSKYKFPDYKRHELEFNFSSNGSTENRQYFQNDQTQKFLSSKNHSNADIKYTFNSLSRKKVDYIFTSISGIYDFTKEKSYSETEATKNNDISSQLEFYWDRQVYWKEDKWFLDITNRAQYYFQQNKTIVPESDNQKDIYHNIDIEIGVGVGIGRIEPVSDLVQSWYILKKLKEQKALARELEEKDIFEFAKFSSKLKNKRFFDARLRKIAELQALDSLLHTNGLIGNNDISYFTTLNDYWSYGNFGNRYSGTVLKFWLGPEYSTSISKAYNEDSNTIRGSTYGGQNLRFESDKQLNLFWDCNFYVGLHNRIFLYQTNSSDVLDYTRQGDLFNASAGFGFGFYPDSRTSIKFSLGYYGYDATNFSYISDGYGPSGVVENKHWSNTLNSSIGGAYYISPQLQVTGNFNLNYYQYNESSKSKYLYTSYNLGLRYAIF
jgi:hypothetical protein